MASVRRFLMEAGLYVVDASALVTALTGRAHATVLDELFVASIAVVAPAHLDAEVLSALSRMERAGDLTPGDVHNLLDELVDAPIDRVPLPPLLASAYQLRGKVAMRDALYVTLAQRSAGTLVTGDHRLAHACGQLQLCPVVAAAESS